MAQASPGDFNDTFALDLSNSQWSPLSPAGILPQARLDHSGVYDPTSGRMIVFGGGLGQTSPCANDVWALANATSTSSNQLWTQLRPSGTPPPGGHGQRGIYDSASNRMIIFGGNDCFSTSFNDVWILSNANGIGGTPTWSQLPTANAPSVRFGHTAVYDPSSNRMIIFAGGSATSGALGDTWVLSNANGIGDAANWTQIVTTGTPILPRGGHTAVYHQASNRMIVFAGQARLGQILNDVWILSNANGLGGASSWTEIILNGALPEPRYVAQAVYDPVKDLMTIFGGFSVVNGAPLNDVWVLSGAGSVNLQPMITTSCPLPSGSYGKPYGPLQLASTVAPPVNWSVSSGNLPTGLNLSALGVVVGVPTTNWDIRLRPHGDEH